MENLQPGEIVTTQVVKSPLLVDGTYKKIGLLDHMGGGNLGDDATQTTVIHNVKRRWPNAEIIGLSMNPRDTQKRHGIPSYAIRRETWDSGPIRRDSKLPPDTACKPARSKVALKARAKTIVSKYPLLFRLLRAINTVAIRVPKAVFRELFFLVESFRIIKSFDLLIISGGGQLLDSWGGPWKFPYTIFKWVLLARLANVSRVFLNVGAGPLVHPLSKFFVKRALLFGDYVSFRDETSKALIREIGFEGRSQVFPDSVYSLEIPVPAVNVTDTGGQGKSVVGMAPMAYCDPRNYWKKDQIVYNDFIQKLALFGSWLMRHDYSLTLFSSDIWFDSQAIEDLRIALWNKRDITNPGWITHDSLTTTEELLAKMSLMDYVVTCRFHGVIFAHMLNKPILAISHHPKVTTLMDDIGLSEYCVDIDHLNLDLLVRKFGLLVEHRDEIKRRMAEKVARYRKELTVQFDDLFLREVRFNACLKGGIAR